MKRIISTFLIFSLGLPVFAQDFSSLCVERDRIAGLILTGQAAASDVDRFNQLVAQIQAATIQKVQSNSQQMSNIYSNLDRMNQQNETISKTLFGNSTPSVPLGTNYSISSPNSGYSSPSDPLRYQSPRLDQSKSIISGITYVGNLSGQLNKVVDLAVTRDEKVQAAAVLVAKYSTKTAKAKAFSIDAINYLVPFSGFNPSKEAADVITGESGDPKNLAAAVAAQQKEIDRVHQDVVTYTFQLAMGVGNKDQAIIDSGTVGLTELIGADETKNLNDYFTQQILVNPTPVTWDVKKVADKKKQLIQAALQKDEVIKEITLAANKYNKRSKLMMTTANVVMPLLGILGMAPSFVGPAAKGAMAAFVMSTGGQESSKMLKEMYLFERLESRMSVIANEADMALEYYQLSSYTGNYALQQSSVALMEKMADSSTVGQVLSD